MGIVERHLREKKRRKQSFIVAAARCFKKYGYETTTISQIAKEAELSTGTIYLYFENKDDLFASVLLNTLKNLFLRLEFLASEKRLDRKERLKGLLDAVLDAYEEDPESIIRLIQLLPRINTTDKSFHSKREIAFMFEKIKSLTTEIMKEDPCEIGHKDPGVLPDFFWSAFIGMAVMEADRMKKKGGKTHLKSKLGPVLGSFQ